MTIRPLVTTLSCSVTKGDSTTPEPHTSRAFVMPGEADMVTAQRTRDDVLRELSRLTHRAGRMTVASLGYEPTHGEIDALLEELDQLDGRGR